MTEAYTPSWFGVMQFLPYIFFQFGPFGIIPVWAPIFSTVPEPFKVLSRIIRAVARQPRPVLPEIRDIKATEVDYGVPEVTYSGARSLEFFRPGSIGYIGRG